MFLEFYMLLPVYNLFTKLFKNFLKICYNEGFHLASVGKYMPQIHHCQ